LMPLHKSDILRILSKLESILSEEKCQAYIVGGLVRDWLLERETSDIDITVNINSTELAKKIARELNGQFVVLDEANETARVIITEQGRFLNIDLSHFSGTIQQDLHRRDFTINALAIDLFTFVSDSYSLIDPFKGQVDLNNKIIRVVSNSAFKEDGARLLRAVRIAAELGFEIEASTEQLIQQDAFLISSVSGERQRDELLRILHLNHASALLRYLDKLKLLTNIIPELETMRGIEQPAEHYWDVLNHSFETVATVGFLLHEANWEYGSNDLLEFVPWSDKLSSHFDEEVSVGSNRRSMLKIGGLLHDIAKPELKRIDDTGRMRFIGHDKLGAGKAAEILQRLRFSNREIKQVEAMVLYHLRPVQMSNIGMPTNRAIYRYFRDTGDSGIDIFLLAQADYLAARGPNLDKDDWLKHNQLINYMIAENEKQQVELLPVKLIDGDDIMKTFHLTSGPMVGKLLRLVFEAQASGEVKTRDEAINLAGKEIGKKVDISD
jgi:poly(A) polymerase